MIRVFVKRVIYGILARVMASVIAKKNNFLIHKILLEIMFVIISCHL